MALNQDAQHFLVPIFALVSDFELHTTPDSAPYNSYEAFGLDETLKSFTFVKTDGNVYTEWHYDTIPSDLLAAPWFTADDGVIVLSSNLHEVGGWLEFYRDAVVVNCLEVFGDGTYDGVNYRLDFTPVHDGDHLSLAVYNTVSYTSAFDGKARYGGGTTATKRVENILHGKLIEMPEGVTRTDEESAKSPAGKAGYSALGTPTFYNQAVEGERRSTTIRYSGVTPTQLATIEALFSALAGEIPCWYLPDVTDNETWRYGTIKSLDVSEPSGEFYEVSIVFEGLAWKRNGRD